MSIPRSYSIQSFTIDQGLYSLISFIIIHKIKNEKASIEEPQVFDLD